MPTPSPRSPLSPSLAEAVADIPAVRPAGIGALARLLAVSGLVGLFLGSEPLSTWAQNKPEAPQWLLDATAGWNGAMASIGLAELYPALRGVVERARGDGVSP